MGVNNKSSVLIRNISGLNITDMDHEIQPLTEAKKNSIYEVFSNCIRSEKTATAMLAATTVSTIVCTAVFFTTENSNLQNLSLVNAVFSGMLTGCGFYQKFCSKKMKA